MKFSSLNFNIVIFHASTRPRPPYLVHVCRIFKEGNFSSTWRLGVGGGGVRVWVLFLFNSNRETFQSVLISLRRWRLKNWFLRGNYFHLPGGVSFYQTEKISQTRKLYCGFYVGIPKSDKKETWTKWMTFVQKIKTNFSSFKFEALFSSSR